ncbi:MAG TPA: GAF domain-containing sensor histidine kinase [Dehalococcoidia bacterium]|nr:GAF domain-containing sensor histidine kinase [Dehalococcoidia bacterium]
MALPAVSIFLLLAFTDLVLVKKLSSVPALLIATGIAIAGVSLFSSLVFSALEPLRRRLLAQNEELRVSGERLQAVYEAGVKITSDLSLAAVLHDVVEASRRVAGARYGALAVLDESGTIVDFVTSGVSEEERARMGHIPRGRGLIGHVLSTGMPYRTADIASDPHAVGFPPGHPRMHSFLGVPLLYKGRVVGNLYLTDKEDGAFTEQDERAIQAFATQAAVAIQNARLYEQVQDMAVLRERERIGMDLHDGTIQQLYGLGLKLEDCIGRVQSEPEEVREELDEAIERINAIIRDIRSYIFDLRPLRLQGSDLVTALGELVMETRVNTLMTVDLRVNDEHIADSLTEEQASQLFAIAHEALANVRKHAQARTVTVSLSREGGRLSLQVADDGRGMQDREHATGRGLGNMADRAEALGGSFTLESAPGKGTAVTVEVPLRRQA